MVILLSSLGLQDVRAWVPVWEGAVHAHVAATAPDGRALALCQTDPTMYTDPAAGDHVQQPMGLLRATRRLLAAAGYCVRPPRSSRRVESQARFWQRMAGGRPCMQLTAGARAACRRLLRAISAFHKTGLGLVCGEQDLHSPLQEPPALLAAGWACCMQTRHRAQAEA